MNTFQIKLNFMSDQQFHQAIGQTVKITELLAVRVSEFYPGILITIQNIVLNQVLM